MGTSRSSAELVGKLNAAGRAVKSGAKPAMRKATTAAVKVFDAAPGRPHVVAKRPVSVRAVYTGELDATVRFRGPIHLVNNRTKPHLIKPRRFVGTRSVGPKANRGSKLLAAFGVDASAGRGAVKLSDGNLRRTVWHPGTKGNRFFQKATPAAQKAATNAVRAEMASQIRAGLKG